MSYALPIRLLPSSELPENSLALIRSLISKLDEHRIEYCHWKSNASLESALSGAGDLDLLVASGSQNAFQSLVFNLGFKLAHQPLWAAHPGIYHYFGFDESTGKIVHLHVYYRLITGGVLLKNFHLPIENKLLSQTVHFHGVRITSRAGELATLVVRKMLEASFLPELMLLIKDWDHVRSEVDWLLPLGDKDNEQVIAESYAILHLAFLTLDPHQYRIALETLRGHSSWLQLHRVARRFVSNIRHYTLRPRFLAPCISAYRALRRVGHKIFRRAQPAKRVMTTGQVIAIVGPEASGKSTITSDVAKWMRGAFDTRLIHTGKPPATVLSWLPNQAVRLYRRLRKNERFTRHEQQGAGKSSLPPQPAMLWLYTLRSIWLAYDRKRTVIRAHRRAARGQLVICDRYPTPVVGAMDSPRLDESHPRIRDSQKLSWLARLEQRIYASMPCADTIVRLDVPLAVALRRNRERIKADKEGDSFVEKRHAQWQKQTFPCDDIVTIDTSSPINEVIHQVRQEIWRRI